MSALAYFALGFVCAGAVFHRENAAYEAICSLADTLAAPGTEET